VIGMEKDLRCCAGCGESRTSGGVSSEGWRVQ
jgi:hypothetical protein